MLKKKVPARLWDYGFAWVCEIENVSANLSKYADGRTPIEIITGDTPDISEYLDFEFYDWVLFRSNAGLGEVELGRWLGVSHRVGRMMSYWLLPPSGIPISATTVQRFTNAERATDEMQKRMDEYNEKLKVLFEAQSADITHSLYNVPSDKIIDPKDEDPTFYDDFARVIEIYRYQSLVQVLAQCTSQPPPLEPTVHESLALRFSNLPPHKQQLVGNHIIMPHCETTFLQDMIDGKVHSGTDGSEKTLRSSHSWVLKSSRKGDFIALHTPTHTTKQIHSTKRPRGLRTRGSSHCYPRTTLRKTPHQQNYAFPCG
jgi:hypothetical protein